MEPRECKELKELLANVITAMTECMEERRVNYRRRDIKKCARIVNLFLEEISVSKNKIEGIFVINNTIEQLNLLDETSKHPLIGTMEREDLCEIINTASEMKAYSNAGDDVTGGWRHW